MILLPHPIIPPIITLLSTSTYNFHLSGSRYFFTHNPMSDFNFLSEHSKELEDYLTSIDFKPFPIPFQYNTNIISIYQHNDPEELEITHGDEALVISNRSKITTIHLVKNINLSITTQETILQLFPEGIRDKSTLEHVWYTVYTFIINSNISSTEYKHIEYTNYKLTNYLNLS